MATTIFIHGSGCTGDVFAYQCAAFEGSRALNLPGHAAAGSASSIAEFADGVAEECAPLEDVILVGNSMGGAIALELALRSPHWLRAIALIGSGAKLRVAPRILDELGADFPAAARNIVKYFFADPTQARVDAATAEMLRVGQEQTLRDFRACDAFDVSDRLEDIAIPVLALAGEHDVMTPPKFAQYLADRIPGAVARILPRAGHLAMLESPEDTNEALRAFVTRIES